MCPRSHIIFIYNIIYIYILYSFNYNLFVCSCIYTITLDKVSLPLVYSVMFIASVYCTCIYMYGMYALYGVKVLCMYVLCACPDCHNYIL